MKTGIPDWCFMCWSHKPTRDLVLWFLNHQEQKSNPSDLVGNLYYTDQPRHQKPITSFNVAPDQCISLTYLLLSKVCWYFYGANYTKQESKNHTSHSVVFGSASTYHNNPALPVSSPLLSHSTTATTRHLRRPRWPQREAWPPPAARLTRASRPPRLPPSRSAREPPRNRAASCWLPTPPRSTDPPSAPSRNLRHTPTERARVDLVKQNVAHVRHFVGELGEGKHSSELRSYWFKCYVSCLVELY